jgi:hypothetical protein
MNFLKRAIRKSVPSIPTQLTDFPSDVESAPRRLMDMGKQTVAIPVTPTMAQVKSLLKGGAVTFRAEHFPAEAAHQLMLLPQTARRIATAIKKGKGLRITLKPAEDIMHCTAGSGKKNGEGILETLRSIGSKTGSVFSAGNNIPFNPFDLGYSLGHDVIAPGLMRAGIGPKAGGALAKINIKKIVKDLTPAIKVIEDLVKSDAGKTIIKEVGAAAKDYMSKPSAGAGMLKQTRGGPRVSMASASLVGSGLEAVSSMRKVEAIDPASSIIQIGSPFQRIHSPAMSPFIAPNILAPNRIGGAGFMPAGIGRGFYK